MPLRLRKNGFTYIQVCRDDKRALYAQTVTSELTYYEVFRIKIRPEGLFKGKLILSGEVFPGNEAFGVSAWTYKSLEKAMEKFNSLPE